MPDLSSTEPGRVVGLLSSLPGYPPLRKLWGFAQLILWLVRGKPVPPPRLVKQRTVRAYAKRFGVATLVETGTYLGHMVIALRNQFDRIFTIEIDQGLARRARALFEREEHIRTFEGDSREILPKVVQQIDGPALFWLDAHYSDETTGGENQPAPVLSEVNSILANNSERHVLLIDDMRCFIGEGSFPTQQEVFDLVRRLRPSWIAEINDDIMRIHPHV